MPTIIARTQEEYERQCRLYLSTGIPKGLFREYPQKRKDRRIISALLHANLRVTEVLRMAFYSLERLLFWEEDVDYRSMIFLQSLRRWLFHWRSHINPKTWSLGMKLIRVYQRHALFSQRFFAALAVEESDARHDVDSSTTSRFVHSVAKTTSGLLSSSS